MTGSLAFFFGREIIFNKIASGVAVDKMKRRGEGRGGSEAAVGCFCGKGKTKSAHGRNQV